MKRFLPLILGIFSLSCSLHRKVPTDQIGPGPLPTRAVLAAPVITTAPALGEHEQIQLAEWRRYSQWSVYAAEIAGMGDKQRKIAYLDAQAALKIEETLDHRLQFLMLASFQTRLRDWPMVEKHLTHLQTDPCFPQALHPWLTVLETRLQFNRGNQAERIRLQRNIRDLRHIQESLRQKIDALSQIETDMGKPETKEQQP